GAKNYSKRLGLKQVCELGDIAMFQRNSLRNSSFARGTLGEFQHRLGGIEQRHVKTKLRQAHRDRAGTAPNIQSAQRLCVPLEKVLQVGKREIEAQSALGRLEVGGVFGCAGLEPFEVVVGIGIGGHFSSRATDVLH